MASQRRYVYMFLLLSTVFVASGCAATLRQPILLEPGFQFSSVEHIGVLPPVDARVEKKNRVDLPRQINRPAMSILSKRGYQVTAVQDTGEVGEITEEDLKEAKPEWVNRLGPPTTRWVMVLCLADLRTKLTFGSTGNAEVTGYLFDKAVGKLVWKDKGVGQVGQGGLLGMAMKSTMDDSALGVAVSNVFATVPKSASKGRR